MQIATLNYDYVSKENGNTNDHRPKPVQQHRHVLTTLAQNQRKHRHRQSFISEMSVNGSVPLPPIAGQRRTSKSMRVTGSSLAATKLSETRSRSQSRESLLSSTSQRRNSRSVRFELSFVCSFVMIRSKECLSFLYLKISPGGTIRPSSKFVNLKFGHPVKLRSPEFYHPDKFEEQNRSREAGFVNDSIRSAHQSRRQSIIPAYEPLADPHLKNFFQSPIVFDIVRKTLSPEQSLSFKTDDRSSNFSRNRRRSKTVKLFSIDNRFRCFSFVFVQTDPNDYRRIVSKGSSGYGKLNGYDCIPPSSPARLNGRRSSAALDGSVSNLTRYTSTDSRLHNSSQMEKTRISTDTSVNSFPTRSSLTKTNEDSRRRNLRRQQRFKPPKPVATSSPNRNTLRQLTEERTTSRAELVPDQNSNKDENPSEQQNEEKLVQSAGSQD